ncbi:hypothetical protein [Nannocystis exedens]|uniref:hypothetical protein n=1 Tax=Nannocystis exedens TaxID=54 RepID=UPI0011607F3C|nr:hypothetical protein [Nannocystis exedens]
MQREVVLQPAHDCVGEQAAAGEPALDRSLGRLEGVRSPRGQTSAARCASQTATRQALEHLADLLADPHKRVEFIELDVDRQDLDLDARQALG